MHARAAAAARARNASSTAAAAHTGLLQVLQIQRTPEELAADAREEKQDMLSSAAQSQQAAQARARNRALQEADQAAKLAKKRAANRERMQRLRNEDAFRELEVCSLCVCMRARVVSVYEHGVPVLCVSECGEA